MRESILQAREKHENTISAIQNLKTSTAVLTLEIEKAQQTSKAENREAASFAGVGELLPAAAMCHLRLISDYGDLIFTVCSFLSLREIIALDCSANLVKGSLINTQTWHELLREHVPHRLQPWLSDPCFGFCLSRVPADLIREDVLEHVRASRECLKFLQQMKEQRCVLKHRTIAPKRLGASDAGISHPLPVFETSHAAQIGRIMSRTETLDRDFRTFALNALETIVRVSSFPNILNDAMMKESAASVFVSLLSNEADQLKHLACSALANLLCWESAGAATGSAGVFAGQLELCGGKKVLFTLLTSPSASINLAGNLKNGSTAPVQGVCNAEASRALINLFCAQFPVPPPAYLSGGRSNSSAKGQEPIMHDYILSEFPRMRAWMCRYFTRSGELKDEFISYLSISPDGRVRGKGCDQIGFFLLNGTSEVDINCNSFKISKSYLSQSEVEESSSWLLHEGDHDDQSSQLPTVHIRHYAFYTRGLGAHGHPNNGQGQFGLFGVWEPASVGSHFSLEKGGVFSAQPVIH